MTLPTPLRALCVSDPEAARARIRTALLVTEGNRGRAAALLARPGYRGRPGWLPEQGAYKALWRCIVALGMGEEVRQRWPSKYDARARA